MPATTIIRQANLDDAAPLAQLAEHTFRTTFTTGNDPTDMDLHCVNNFGTEIQQKEILDSNYVSLVAEINDQLIAFAQVRRYSPKDCVAAPRPSELYRLYVSKEWHGQGVAQQIMARVFSTAAEAGAEHIWLGVWEHNPRAIAFYRKFDFKVVGDHIFQFGCEAQRDLVMVTAVKPALTHC